MIASGTILVERSTALPQCLQLEGGTPSANSWVPVVPTHGFPEFESELRATGWTFFYMANTITAISLGFDHARTAQVAVQRLIAKAEAQRCNSLEVGDVSARSFLGIPYMRVSAHPRHIQKGMAFDGQPPSA